MEEGLRTQEGLEFPVGCQVIITRNLTKRFGNFTAVDHINMEILRGEIFGFLGPNGAGKSTVIRMLTTLTTPSEGSASVDGYDIRTQANEVRKKIGLVAEKLILYPRLSAVQNLMFFGQLYGLEGTQLKQKISELLKLVRLEAFKNMPVGGYSSGMRQRVNIIRGLLHNPDILFLDEPTALLDPQSIQFVHDLIRELNDDGKTIILTTHIMEEADQLSHRIGIIDHGKIIAVDTPVRLKNKHGSEILLEVFLKLTGRELRDSASKNVPMRRVMGRG